MDTEAELKQFFKDFTSVKKAIVAIANKSAVVNSKEIRDKVDTLCSVWFSTIKPELISKHGFSDEDAVIKNRNDAFTHLIQLSSIHGNKKAAYLKDIKAILTKAQLELISPIKTKGTTTSAIDSVFDSVINSISDSEQSEYLREAVNCAKSGYLKASVVLGWCACVDHIHNKIDRVGYPKFNITSAQLASQKTGRFKRFNSTYNISSLSELREVFDRDILIIIEGMQLIDSNQGVRLRSCFEMRNHSGHPGEAPITPFNIVSFFSDIIEIVIANEKFKIS